ncbi:hypothetical protein RRG08_020723 [Elysia crispata]|uniref:Uncharacterized protein n=1 Tax=Elysia crispata TaxID=231223 RepID=A0AAE0Z2J0_9GAST|nr:hypothetical protein RRG08_020723 [Elysia crispata]
MSYRSKEQRSQKTPLRVISSILPSRKLSLELAETGPNVCPMRKGKKRLTLFVRPNGSTGLSKMDAPSNSQRPLISRHAKPI